MFRKRQQPVIAVSKLSSLIAPGVEIVGDVIVTDGLRVDGRIDGNVRSKPGTRGLLVLSERGGIRGTVRVHDAVVNGTIEGDLEVEHYLELQASARVTGNITYRQLRLDCGAVVHGRLERLSDSDAPAPADNVVNVQFAQAAP